MAIGNYLEGKDGENLSLYPMQPLRYGENPHQAAVLLGYHPGDTPLGGQVLQGKELSYNNLLDLDAAWRAVVSYQKSSIVIVKHLSPCGMASSDNQLTAYQAALASDPVSAFGGIIAANRTLETDTAAAISDLFVECIIAPGFDPEALDILAKKKNLRLVQMPDLEIEPKVEYRSIVRGVLRQDVDLGDTTQKDWKVVTEKTAHRRRNGSHEIRLDGLPACQIQFNCLCPGRSHGGYRRRAAQSGGLRSHCRTARR